MNAVKRWFAAAVVVAAAGLGVLAAPSAAWAGSYQGGVDMQGACNAQHPGTVARVTNPSDAYSWRCTSSGGSYNINVDQQCFQQYGNASHSGLSNSQNPYSWYCQYAGCYGAGCVHVDPGATDCGGGYGKPMEYVTVPGGGAQIVLKWSALCHANWARWVNGVSAPSYWNYWVQTSDGHIELPNFGGSEWTYMVNGNLPARACIQGNWDPTPACTGWH